MKYWGDFEAKGLYTNASLKRKGLKAKANKGTWYKVYTNGKWKEFKFYTIEEAEPIKVRKKPIIRDLEINSDNLCESLYVINKSAKKSRDSKQENYYGKNYGIVNRCKDRQEKIYELKNDVLLKMIDERIVSLNGYHVQLYNGKRNILLFYTYKEFSFHIIDNFVDEKAMNFLGLIESLISSKMTRKTEIKYNEAIKLLEKYLSIDEYDTAI